MIGEVRPDCPRPAEAPPAQAPNAGARARVDYSHEVRELRNPLVRWVLITVGWLCVISGMIGVVLPGWPTTPFIILATFFFARSSPRFYNWVMNHRVFGPLIRDWRDGKGMTARAKTIAVTTIVITISISITVIPITWVRVLLAVIMVTLCTYLLRLPTKPPPEAT